MSLKDLAFDMLNLTGPFAEGLAQALVAKSGPVMRKEGAEAVQFLKGKLLGTATTADDTIILGNLREILEGALEELDAT